ncbi:hypothetical protein STEG23_032254 [Scotinomys teguina]
MVPPETREARCRNYRPISAPPSAATCYAAYPLPLMASVVLPCNILPHMISILQQIRKQSKKWAHEEILSSLWYLYMHRRDIGNETQKSTWCKKRRCEKETGMRAPIAKEEYLGFP